MDFCLGYWTRTYTTFALRQLKLHHLHGPGCLVVRENTWLLIDPFFRLIRRLLIFYLLLTYNKMKNKLSMQASGSTFVYLMVQCYLFAFRGSTVKARVCRFLTDVQHCYGTIQEPRADWRQSEFSISFTFLFSNPTGKRRNPNRQGSWTGRKVDCRQTNPNQLASSEVTVSLRLVRAAWTMCVSASVGKKNNSVTGKC